MGSVMFRAILSSFGKKLWRKLEHVSTIIEMAHMSVEDLHLAKDGVENDDVGSGLSYKPVSPGNVKGRPIQRIRLNSSRNYGEPGEYREARA